MQRKPVATKKGGRNEPEAEEQQFSDEDPGHMPAETHD